MTGGLFVVVCLFEWPCLIWCSSGCPEIYLVRPDTSSGIAQSLCLLFMLLLVDKKARAA